MPRSISYRQGTEMPHSGPYRRDAKVCTLRQRIKLKSELHGLKELLRSGSRGQETKPEYELHGLKELPRSEL